MGEVRLFVDDDEYLLYDPSSPEIICCRICHEAKFESSKSLEAPCSCAGTLKFAHRDCIQRWCDEKGNTSCEICLQKFEHGYSAPPPRKPLHVHGVRSEVGVNHPLILAQQETLLETETETESECSTTTASICRFLGLTRKRCSLDEKILAIGTCMQFTLLLLVRHLFAVAIGGTGDYPFSLLTLLVMRTIGILLPIYIIMRTVDAIHNSITIARGYQVSENHDNEHRLDIN